LEYSHTAEANGQRADAAVSALIHPQKEKANDPVVEPGDGFAKNDAATIPVRCTGLLRADKDDANTKKLSARRGHQRASECTGRNRTD